jgi:hypothetical protein
VLVTTAGGAAVVDCSVVVVLEDGVVQPASATVPASSAAPNVRRKRDFVSIIVLFLSGQPLVLNGPPYSASGIPRGEDRRSRYQRTVVVSLDLRVAVVSPVGDTVVPLELERLLSVTTPLMVEVFSVLDEVDVSAGIGVTGAVVVVVVIELEDELCAKAPPLNSVTAIVAASKILIMSDAPGDWVRAGWLALRTGNVAFRFGRRQTRKLLTPPRPG